MLAVLYFCAGAASSHDLWLEKEGNAYFLLQGHRYSSHTGAEVVPYEASCVKGLLCVDGSGGARQHVAGKTYPARIAGGCATVVATFSTGYWTKTAWETRNTAKSGVSGVIKSWQSVESLKMIERWNSASASPLAEGLEITPATNPLQLKVGDKLVVLVTDGGKPLAGVPVAYGGETRGLSGDDGKVAIRLRQGGMQLLQASRETPLNDGQADTLIRTTTLQFEIAR